LIRGKRCRAPALPPSAFEGSTPIMRPERLFAGTTRSTGVLDTRDGGVEP
jgi:hypothetical protein